MINTQYSLNLFSNTLFERFSFRLFFKKPDCFILWTFLSILFYGIFFIIDVKFTNIFFRLNNLLVFINTSLYLFFIIILFIVLRQYLKIHYEMRCLNQAKAVFIQKKDENVKNIIHNFSSQQTLKSIVFETIYNVLQTNKLNGQADSIIQAIRNTYSPQIKWRMYLAEIYILYGFLCTLLFIYEYGYKFPYTFKYIVSPSMIVIITFFILLSLDLLVQFKREELLNEFSSFNAGLLIPFITPKYYDNDNENITEYLIKSGKDMIELSTSINNLVASITNNEEVYAQIASDLNKTTQSIEKRQKDIDNNFELLSKMGKGFVNHSQSIARHHEDISKNLIKMTNQITDEKFDIKNAFQKIESSINTVNHDFTNVMNEAFNNLRIVTEAQKDIVMIFQKEQDIFYKEILNKIAKSIELISSK